jgi:ATP-dependent DNA helicase RecG
MSKIKIFISSVQKEFSAERKLLAGYIESDALLGRFFESFIFEQSPALSSSAQRIYLNEVEHSDIYLGIFGVEYGSQDSEGVSPTEREFDYATLHHKTRLVFISDAENEQREPNELQFIQKTEKSVVRKVFTAYSDQNHLSMLHW